MGAAAVLVMWLRWRVAGGRVPRFPPEANPAANHPEWTVRWRTFCYLASRHALLLCKTGGFSCHYSHESIPLLISPYDPRQLVAIGVLGPLLAFAAAITARFGRVLLATLRAAALQKSERETSRHLGVSWFGTVSPERADDSCQVESRRLSHS